MQWLWDLLGFSGRGLSIDELARRLETEADTLRRCPLNYRAFAINKRRGGTRRILAPSDELKSLQRKILRRLFQRLQAHPAAKGFERGQSIATHARVHEGQAVVLTMDIADFFSSTSPTRVAEYLRIIGWNRPAAKLLVRLCTYDGGLPQGAPTSPRLSNLVNYRMDARLHAAAARYGATYTRYADDLTFSWPHDDRTVVARLRRVVRLIVEDTGYRIHGRKTRVMRRHQRQRVTGLVVNHRARLPRETRRWLRAVEHRASQDWRSVGSDADQPWRPSTPMTLTTEQLAGWRALQKMVDSR